MPDASNERSCESGFGLVEIVVAMFLLAILAMSFLPVLVQTLKISITNVTIATSTQMVDEQMDLFRSQTATCAVLTTFAGASIAAVADPRGQLQTYRSIGSCPSTYPGTVTVRSWVTQSGQTPVLSEAVSLILVKTAT